MKKMRNLAAFLAFLFVASTALVSCEEIDAMIEDINSGFEEEGELDDSIEGGKQSSKDTGNRESNIEIDDSESDVDSSEDDETKTDKETDELGSESNIYNEDTFTSRDDVYDTEDTYTHKDTFTHPHDYDEIAMDSGVVGQDITIIVRDWKQASREWYKDVPEDDVDEIIAYRNELVSAKLKLDSVNYFLMGSSSYEDCLNTFTTAIMEDVDNDFHYYDIVANYAYAGVNVAVRDYLANLADTETFPYFDFSLPCWNQSIIRSTLLNDQLYYITGDLNLSTFDKSMVVFVNKDLYADRKDANDPDDIQDEALVGKWDYEDLYKWATVYEDTNSDGTNSHDDLHGINAALSSIPIDAIPYAWDIDYIVEQEDGSHAYNVIGNTKLAEAVDMAKALFRGVDGFDQTGAQGVANWNWTNSCSLGGYNEPVTHFTNERSVFLLNVLYNTDDDNMYMREMVSEWGLLPMPKYDEDQEDYGTTAYDSYTLVTVIDHSQSSEPTKGRAISAYLELSYEESYTTVRDYYINRIAKQKYYGTTDTLERNREIFDIIADNIEFDFASIYAPQLNGIMYSCWRNVIEGNANVTTAEESFLMDEESYKDSLKDIDQWLGLV